MLRRTERVRSRVRRASRRRRAVDREHPDRTRGIGDGPARRAHRAGCHRVARECSDSSATTTVGSTRSWSAAGPMPAPFGHPPVGPGQSVAASDDVIICEWNDLAVVEQVLSTEEIACVLMEPVMCNTGLIPPTPGYLEGVRDLCRRHGALLVIDEVITGFRLGLTGAQGFLGIQGDITLYAKAVASGYPMAVLGTTQELLSAVGRGEVNHSGTYNASVLSVAAGVETLRILVETDPYPELEQRTTRLVDELRSIGAQQGSRHRPRRRLALPVPIRGARHDPLPRSVRGAVRPSAAHAVPRRAAGLRCPTDESRAVLRLDRARRCGHRRDDRAHVGRTRDDLIGVGAARAGDRLSGSRGSPRSPTSRPGSRGRTRDRPGVRGRRTGGSIRVWRPGVPVAGCCDGAPARRRPRGGSVVDLRTSSVIRSPVRTSASGPPAADSGATCSTVVPKAVPLILASLMRTMSRTPLSEESGGKRHVAHLGHARVTTRAAAPQHEHAVGRDVEVGLVDPRLEVLDRVEHEGRAGVRQQLR